MIKRPLWNPSSKGEAIVSYSQNAEDVRLWRVFRDVEDGFYVDIGASDPSIGSVTRLFYDHGWSGINVEPSPSFEAVQKVRERDVNLRMAVGVSEGSTPFFLTYPDLGVSTLDPSAHAHVQGAVERIEELPFPSAASSRSCESTPPDTTRCWRRGTRAFNRSAWRRSSGSARKERRSCS